MVRLTLVLTVMLAMFGLPEALKPLLFQSGPRLVILTTDEEPHVLNPAARKHAQPPLQSLDQPIELQPVEYLIGPQLGQLKPYAEQLIQPKTQS